MVVTNNTHYFSVNNKVFNEVPDTDSWSFESSRRMLFGQRLYWEYKFCKSVGGQAFFYTFTYNNDSLPHFDCTKIDDDGDEIPYSFPCFSYDHIRLLTNGLISKVLRRKYGSQMRYFVACERGEGKGRYRKKGQNPHYHVIFFIFPLDDSIRKVNDVPYRRISPISFAHLCKSVWQYKSVVDKSYTKIQCDYKSARFGHCQPGLNVGLVTDFDALSYVSKYVVKDTSQSFDDKCVKAYYYRYFRSKGYTWHSLYSYYHYLRVNGRCIDRDDFLEMSGISSFLLFRRCRRCAADRHGYLGWLRYQPDYANFFNQFKYFFDTLYYPQIVDYMYRRYVCSFGSKVRCSKSLGSFGLSFVNDPDFAPHFVLNKSDDVVTQPISLYYYRKLYFDTVTCPKTGNILYVLNERGKELKCTNLPNTLQNCANTLFESIQFVLNNKNNDSFISYFSDEYSDLPSKVNFLNTLLDDNFLKLYSYYHVVYQYRHFVASDPPALSSDVSFLDVLCDYRKFLSSNFYSCDFQSMSIHTYLRVMNDSELVSFDNHPVFVNFVPYFKLCNQLVILVNRFLGDIKKKDFAESMSLRSSLNHNKFVKYS